MKRREQGRQGLSAGAGAFPGTIKLMPQFGIEWFRSAHGWHRKTAQRAVRAMNIHGVLYHMEMRRVRVKGERNKAKTIDAFFNKTHLRMQGEVHTTGSAPPNGSGPTCACRGGSLTRYFVEIIVMTHLRMQGRFSATVTDKFHVIIQDEYMINNLYNQYIQIFSAIVKRLFGW